VLRSGSANLSASALKRQDNDLVVLHDRKAVVAFRARFETDLECSDSLGAAGEQRRAGARRRGLRDQGEREPQRGQNLSCAQRARVCTHDDERCRQTLVLLRGAGGRCRLAKGGPLDRGVMYGLAYVIIPIEFASLQGALDETLAPFKRGGADVFSHDKLEFDDVTDTLRLLHTTPLEFETGSGLSIRGEDLALVHDLDSDAVRSFLDAAGTRAWSGRLADVEPDFDAFAHRFTRCKERDARAGGYGRWLNPLGRWDWWDLGGRYDGAITGARQPGTGNASMISSGPNRGRDLVGGIARAFRGRPSEIEAEIEANIEIVSALLGTARRGEARAFPTRHRPSGQRMRRRIPLVRRPRRATYFSGDQGLPVRRGRRPLQRDRRRRL
jgi:hypothetical protein